MALARGSKACMAYYSYLFYPAILLLVIMIHPDFGVGWDEEFQARYGMLTLKYILSGDRTYEQYKEVRYYGPLFQVTSAVLLFPLWSSDPKRFYLF
ncbi:MAG: hypothetical protein L0191_07440, partial [Acidobacteria bacterium]|nr:hypothetical protein [Acidobacteriota bacterium]